MREAISRADGVRHWPTKPAGWQPGKASLSHGLGWLQLEPLSESLVPETFQVMEEILILGTQSLLASVAQECAALGLFSNQNIIQISRMAFQMLDGSNSWTIVKIWANNGPLLL